MSDSSCARCTVVSPAAAALSLLNGTFLWFTTPDALAAELCPHIADAVVDVLQARAPPKAIKDAVNLLRDREFCSPLWLALGRFIATRGDVEAFALAMIIAAQEGYGRSAVELLDAGPWGELVAPEPDLGRRLRAKLLDARTLLEIALSQNRSDLARALLDRGVDPTLCVCEPCTASWCECHCRCDETCGCMAHECDCNLIERLEVDLAACGAEALRALLRRGCRPAGVARAGSGGTTASLFGALVLHGRREHLEALLEFEDVDTRVWVAREPWLDPLDVTSVELREFALRAGAGWAVKLLDRAARWSPERRAWVGAVLRAPRPSL